MWSWNMNTSRDILPMHLPRNCQRSPIQGNHYTEYYHSRPFSSSSWRVHAHTMCAFCASPKYAQATIEQHLGQPSSCPTVNMSPSPPPGHSTLTHIYLCHSPGGCVGLLHIKRIHYKNRAETYIYISDSCYMSCITEGCHESGTSQ